jgi:integrase/recombinase XerD
MTLTPLPSPMPKHNPENERTKHEYAIYLKEAKRRDEATVDAALAAIHRFEAHTNFRDFKSFDRRQAIAFKQHLAEQTNARTRKPLSKSTLLSTLTALKAFFFWLADQKGYRRRIQYSDADYFNLSEREGRIGRTRLEKGVPSLEQVRRTILAMPSGDTIERRDRALLAFSLLTATRDGAVITLKLKHVDLAARRVTFDAREVDTKSGKSFVTDFYPVGDDIRAIVEEWVRYLENDLGWGPDDPLFPATRQELGPDRQFRAVGLSRKAWSTASPVRDAFRRAFAAAGLPYYSPHRIRDTISALGQKICPTVEAWKAWSQNMGHSHVTTTMTSYGPVSSQRQAELIRGLGRGERRSKEDLVNQIAALTEELRNVD